MGKLGCFLMLAGVAGVIVMAIRGNWIHGVLPMAGAFVLGLALGYIALDRKSKRDQANTRRECRLEEQRSLVAKRKARQALLEEAVSTGDPALAYKALTFDMRVGGSWTPDNCDLSRAFAPAVKEALLKIAAAQGTGPLLLTLQTLTNETRSRTCPDFMDKAEFRGIVIDALCQLKERGAMDLLLAERKQFGLPSALAAMGELAVEPLIGILRTTMKRKATDAMLFRFSERSAIRGR